MGDAIQNITHAIQLISEIQHLKITKKASYYLSKAWGKTDQSDFVNSAIEIECCLTPEQLLGSLQQIEKLMGRVKNEKWGPRIIDLDILTFSEMVVDLPHLKIPHPHITERSFVLVPLYELNKKLFIVNKGFIDKFMNKKTAEKSIIKKYVL